MVGVKDPVWQRRRCRTEEHGMVTKSRWSSQRAAEDGVGMDTMERAIKARTRALLNWMALGDQYHREGRHRQQSRVAYLMMARMGLKTLALVNPRTRRNRDSTT